MITHVATTYISQEFQNYVRKHRRRFKLKRNHGIPDIIIMEAIETRANTMALGPSVQASSLHRNTKKKPRKKDLSFTRNVRKYQGSKLQALTEASGNTKEEVNIKKLINLNK